VSGRLFSPSQKLKKLSQPFRQCFELVFGILNVKPKILWVVYGPILKLQGLEIVKFQGKNCFTKMVSNFSEINIGLIYHEKMSKKYEYDIFLSAQVNRYNFLMVYKPHRVLESIQSGGFQGKNCLTKMVSNSSKINFGLT